MSHSINVATHTAYDLITQDLYSEHDGVKELVLSTVINTRETQIRAALVKLGWTPPADSDWVDWESAGIKSMIAKL